MLPKVTRKTNTFCCSLIRGDCGESISSPKLRAFRVPPTVRVVYAQVLRLIFAPLCNVLAICVCDPVSRRCLQSPPFDGPLAPGGLLRVSSLFVPPPFTVRTSHSQPRPARLLCRYGQFHLSGVSTGNGLGVSRWLEIKTSRKALRGPEPLRCCRLQKKGLCPVHGKRLPSLLPPLSSGVQQQKAPTFFQAACFSQGAFSVDVESAKEELAHGRLPRQLDLGEESLIQLLPHFPASLLPSLARRLLRHGVDSPPLWEALGRRVSTLAASFSVSQCARLLSCRSTPASHGESSRPPCVFAASARVWGCVQTGDFRGRETSASSPPWQGASSKPCAATASSFPRLRARP